MLPILRRIRLIPSLSIPTHTPYFTSTSQPPKNQPPAQPNTTPTCSTGSTTTPNDTTPNTNTVTVPTPSTITHQTIHTTAPPSTTPTPTTTATSTNNVSISSGGVSSKMKMLRIQSIEELIRQGQHEELPDLDKSHYQPFQLFLTLVRALKKNLHLQRTHADKLILQVHKYKADPQYINQFIYLILPGDQLFPQLNNLYGQITLSFLESPPKQINKEHLFCILDNLQRMITQLQSDWSDQQWVLRDYLLEQRIAGLLIPRFLDFRSEINIGVFIKLTKVCSTLSAVNFELAAYLAESISHEACRVKLRDFIAVLQYLAQTGVFPHQFFYKNQKKWLQTIQSYKKYSTKKSFQSIKLLNLFVKQNPMFCQKSIRGLQQILLQSIPSIDPEEQANLWLLICRAKFGIYPQIVHKVLEKIMYNYQAMKLRELCLVVRGFEGFRGLGEYGQLSRYLLVGIKGVLPPTRVYEHAIINQLLKELPEQQQESTIIQTTTTSPTTTTTTTASVLV